MDPQGMERKAYNALTKKATISLDSLPLFNFLHYCLLNNRKHSRWELYFQAIILEQIVLFPCLQTF